MTTIRVSLSSPRYLRAIALTCSAVTARMRSTYAALKFGWPVPIRSIATDAA